MKVELLIADDKELRAAIRELIKSEVLNVARSEIKDIVAGAVGKEYKNSIGAAMNRLLEEEIKKQVSGVLGKRNYGEPSFIEREARIYMREFLKESIQKGNAI